MVSRPGPLRPALPDPLAGGVVRPILCHPDPALREICQPSGYLGGAELARLAAELLATMYAAEGRGLAAPQIGVLRRIVVMDAGWKDGAPEPLILCDPEILVRSDQQDMAEERCLSIPGRAVAVPRSVAVTMRWYRLDGNLVSREFDGWAARIAQHEADHLDGRLILDWA